MFTPGTPPKGDEYAFRELSRLREYLNEWELIRLASTAVAPAKPREGDIRLADGSGWNPGSGAGVYCYYASAWHRLG